MKKVLELIFKSPLFYLGILIKFFFSFYFTSHYLQDFFSPFVNFFVSQGGNPYQQFPPVDHLYYFPYPAVMLYTLSLFKVIFSIFPDQFIYKLPLFVGDILILLVLSSMNKDKIFLVLLLYWLSPITLFISYIHGHLDVIPLSFLFVSFYFLSKKRLYYSIIFMALSLASKTTGVLVLPFYALYASSYLSTAKYKHASLLVLLLISTFFLLNIQFISESTFLNIIFNNRVYFSVLDTFIATSNNSSIYLFIVSYIIISLYAFTKKIKTRDTFLTFLALTFGTITLFTNASLGWYYWFIPFFIYFLLQSRKMPSIVLVTFTLAYILYYIFDNTDTIFFLWHQQKLPFSLIKYTSHIAQGKVQSIIYSILFAHNLFILFYTYSEGIKKFINQKFYSVPFLLGIGGDSGAGKTTLAQLLSDTFGGKSYVNIISGDDIHKWERGHTKWSEVSHLNPIANHIYSDYNQLKKLSHGYSIHRHTYDHDSGKFSNFKEKIKPTNLIIYEGLHPFYLEKTAQVFDLKIFLATDEQLVMHRKVIRDITKRSSSKEKVIAQIKQRRQDYEKYIMSQLHKANIVISECLLQKNINIGDIQESTHTHFKVLCQPLVNTDKLIDHLEQLWPSSVTTYYTTAGYLEILIADSLKDQPDNSLIASLLSSINNDSYPQVWNAGSHGVLQFILTYYIEELINESLYQR
jgi:uridine kinase